MKPLRFQIKNKNIKFKSHSPKYNFLKYVTFRKWTKLVLLQVIFWSYWKIDMWKNAYIIKLWLYIFIFFGIRSIFFIWEPHKKYCLGVKISESSNTGNLCIFNIIFLDVGVKKYYWKWYQIRAQILNFHLNNFLKFNIMVYFYNKLI